MGVNPVAVGLAGYGAVAELHVAALRDAGARLVAISGPQRASATAFAERHAIPQVFADLQAMLALPEIDAVVVASPSPVHAAQAAEVLRSGRHVLVEIPIALGLADAELIATAARTRGVVAMAGHTQRYWPAVKELMARITRDRLAVRHVVVRSAVRRLDNVGWTGRARSWTDNLLWHHGGHVLDTALLVMGEPAAPTVVALAPTDPRDGPPLELGIIVRARRSIATIALSYTSSVPANDCLVITDRATFRMDEGRLFDQGGRLLVGDAFDPTLRSAIGAQDREFIDAITSGLSPATSVERVMPTLKLLQQVEDAIRPSHPGGNQ